ncbi:MAG: hypothetical protein IJQ56_08135 [Synergistaceae bacterium]|nr:hypothetical protein [Synergistaceae bacterium]
MGKLLLDSTGQTIATGITTLNTNLQNMQGSLADLQTTSKLNLVSAINELKANIGILGSLDTEANSSLVAAINEVAANAGFNGTIWDLLDEYTDGGAGLHNSIFRGKNLGTSVTSEQWAQIQAGTFKDMYIGDYWVVTVPAGTYNGTSYSARDIKFRIADFNYWLNTYQSRSFLATPHIVLVPDEPLYNAKMNDTNTTEGGYYGSKMFTTYLADAKTIINNAFGANHILSHYDYYTNAVTSGVPSGATWQANTVDIMSERMVYGAKVYGQMPNGNNLSGFHTVCKSQLNLFRLRHDLIAIGPQYYWLRDVVSAASFAFVISSGSAYYYYASYSFGVRPAVAIA